jgi:hypothetical protein
MTKRPLAPAVLATFTLAACATGSAPSGAQVFGDPRAHMGKEVSVCGYLVGISNITARSPVEGQEAGPGFALNGQAGALRRALRGGRSRVCLTGTLTYVGCASGDEICLGWMYDYVLNVHRVGG